MSSQEPKERASGDLALTDAPPRGLRPPFPWPGGKRRLTDLFLPLCPGKFGRYVEPFAGSAALYFRLLPAQATLGDHNDEVINFYTVLRDSCAALGGTLSSLPTDSDTYYRVRRHRPLDNVARAARFVYLTTLAFNGIYRVNANGRFNTPYGGRPYASLRNPSWLQPLSDALQGVTLASSDFASTVAGAVPGDLIYLDPPYTVAHENNGFVRYNERIFSFADQVRLAHLARDLVARGCTVLVSNARHDSIRELYSDFEAVTIGRRSTMAADASMRRAVEEYLLVGRPLR